MTSWVITDTATGYRFETWSQKNADMAEASPRYRVEPLLEYLVRINEEAKESDGCAA